MIGDQLGVRYVDTVSMTSKCATTRDAASHNRSSYVAPMSGVSDRGYVCFVKVDIPQG